MRPILTRERTTDQASKALNKKSGAEFDQWLQMSADESLAFDTTDVNLPVLVVGAGPAGLAAMTAFAQADVAFEGIDSHTGIGGIWDPTNPVSSAYEGLHMVTSRFTSFLGSPMPDDYKDYVDQDQALRYLRNIADRENLGSRIRFSTKFETAEKTPRGTWLAQLSPVNGDESYQKEYRAIVIATGSHNRLHASYPTELRDQAVAAGLQVSHSAEYRTHEEYAGKRVVVIGVGNSGTDIADQISRVAARTLIAVRTSPWINPQYFAGIPCDKLVYDGSRFPEWLGMSVFMAARRWAIGSFRRLGLRRPDYKLNDRVPVSDRGIVRAIREGRVLVRSSVKSFDSGKANFEDPSQPSEPIDAVIFATGFQRSYPLLDGPPSADRLSFYLFDRHDPSFVVMTEMVGLRCCWPIFYDQGQAVAAYFAAEQRGSCKVAEFNKRRHLPMPPLKGGLLRLADEHSIDYDIYVRLLRGLANWFQDDQPMHAASKDASKERQRVN